MVLSDHQRANLRLKVTQALELAPWLCGQQVMRSEAQGVFLEGMPLTIVSLLLLLWMQCPLRRHG